MERESFEDESTALLMNENFVNIKIDREERPDLDHIYMDAVQAITGSGGWPLNVFLTPDAKPFYGGTYFPPQKAFNRPSWKDTLNGIIQAFKDRRHEINAQAENLTDHLFKANSFGQQKTDLEKLLVPESADEIYDNLMIQADREWGGFGKAPKFPQTFSIQFLLRHALTKKSKELSESSTPPLLKERQPSEAKVGSEARGGEVQATLSLDRMIEGGIYDQVGGGFARYSTDTKWLVPHFEKMLYDNALLISVLSEAFQLTHKKRYREIIEETMKFIERELLHPLYGFYSALDADSEGEEGKYYTWELDEINELLKEDAAVFCSYYDITQEGNLPAGEAGWEGKNILHVKKTIENFSVEQKTDADELNKILNKGKKILLEKRSKRIAPLLDDKIILGWNALMNTASSKAFEATSEERFRELATRNMDFLFTHLKKENSFEFYHTWKNDVAKFPAFLDDYAYLVQALIRLHEITTDKKWLLNARSVCEYVIENFSEPETGFFYYTATGQKDVIVRKKELYDGAVPSGNAIMAYNLHQLGILFDVKDWKERSVNMLSTVGNAVIKYPGSFGNWASLLQEIITGTNEIVIIGKDFFSLHVQLLNEYMPHRILMASEKPDEAFPLLRQKQLFVQPAIWLCSNYTCLHPVFSLKELISLINNPQNR